MPKSESLFYVRLRCANRTYKFCSRCRAQCIAPHGYLFILLKYFTYEYDTLLTKFYDVVEIVGTNSAAYSYECQNQNDNFTYDYATLIVPTQTFRFYTPIMGHNSSAINCIWFALTAQTNTPQHSLRHLMIRLQDLEE